MTSKLSRFNVDATCHVASTLIQRCFKAVCLLGRLKRDFTEVTIITPLGMPTIETFIM